MKPPPVPEPASPASPNWTLSGGKFLNASSGIHPEINRLVIIDDGNDKYRGRAFVKSGRDAWWASFIDVEWVLRGTHSDGERFDCTLTPEQYEQIKEDGSTKGGRQGDMP